MPRLNRAQKVEIIRKTDDTLKTLLSFHVAYSGMNFVYEDVAKNWRELESRLHIDYPIKGVGVKATRTNLKINDTEDGGFLHKDEPLYPGHVPSELQSFPVSAASAAYTFTLLEGYGDDLVNIVNPAYLKERQAWHHGVYSDANLSNPDGMKKAKKGFSKPFKASSIKVTNNAVQRLVAIKVARNCFMHKGDTHIDFEDFFASVLATVSFLHFLVLPSEKELSAYPYYDYDQKWL
jgi:hypothetical protein